MTFPTATEADIALLLEGTFPDTFFSPYVLVWHGVVFTLFEALNIGMIGIGLALL